MAIYRKITQCPECGDGLNREPDIEVRGRETREVTTCHSPDRHRWLVIKIRRDRSVWFWDLIGPLDDESRFPQGGWLK